MASTVVYGHEWGRAIDQGLAPENFEFVLLCEGDSWMDRSSPAQLSLPWALQESFDASGHNALLVNLSHFGDTMVRIGEHVNGEFLEWVSSNRLYRAILVSAGGNDFIDAALDPPVGEGLLNVHRAGMTGADHVNATAVKQLRDDYLHRHFATLVDAVRHSPQGDVKIYLNSYCVPVARNAPAYPGGKSWLARAYTNHGIPASLWPAVTEEVFRQIGLVVQDWAASYANVVQVPTTLANLDPATAATGSSGDWANEIHPNAKGWRKLAPVWRQTMGV
ncbi:MAG TPA: hypothetical protein VHA82_22960 [Ramlibacter sp.]|uniref:hypothetical protein n=1 Tax=Ramlibacter sp. TaxID=1917967 RepID=UPI002C52236D|nr:hypothetical protein [Ramlibacter sp.]HVZ46685.1 hypothetical protein [Ramlibacter sp.]